MIHRLFWVAIFLSAFDGSAQMLKVAAWGNNGYGEAWVPPNLGDVRTAIIEGNSGLALLEDGRLAAWGSNLYGQTNFPSNATNIIAIARSSTHSLALRTNGTAVGWGAAALDPFNSAATNFSGQSGITQIAAGYGFTLLLQSGQVSQRPSTLFGAYGRMTAPFPLSSIKQISAGADVAVALRSNGTVVVWGNPACTNPPAGLSDVKYVSAGNDHVTALRSNGTIVAWGENYWKQTNVPAGLSNVIAVEAGAFHNLALRSDGSLVTWGDGWAGESLMPGGLTNVTAIAARGPNSIAIISNGLPQISKQPKSHSVFPGNSIKLGVTATGLSPLSFQWQREGTNLVGETNSILVLTNVVAEKTGNYTITVSNPLASVVSEIATVDLGPIVAWGGNSIEQLETPPGLTNVSAIVGRRNGSFALRTDGTIARWGENPYGNTTSVSNVTAIGVGASHALFLHQDGTVSAWGENLFGETEVPPETTNALAVSAGSVFSVAINRDRTVTAWGRNATNVPAGLSNVIAIACGYDHTLALKSDGLVVAWGYSFSGATNVPANLSNVVAIAAGANASVALKDDGTIVGWGGGITIPASISNVVAISHDFAGNVLALRNDSSVIAFGNFNGSGQNNVPVGLTNVTRIASGFSHSLALVGDGSPAFPTELSEHLVEAGDTLRLPALAAGGQPMTYQWQFNGENISGQTNSTLSITNTPLTAAGIYRVIVSNAAGTKTNNATVVTVSRKPIRFDSFTHLFSGNDMNLHVTGLAGSGPVVLFASTNFVDWLPIATNSATVGDTDFTISATNETQFFRIIEEE